MARRITRRQALAGSAASLGYLYTAPAFAAANIYQANGKLYVAGIGVGGKGSSDIDHAANLMEVAAICDIDEGPKFLGAKATRWPQAKKFTDYRKLFDDKDTLKTIDAVTVSTPDHNHAQASILAIRNKKHVYVQKPMTHDVFEARMMREEAKKYGVCTQMGNQGTAANGLRRAVELIQAGTIGQVKEAHVWTNRPIWPQAPAYTARPAGEEKPVATIHWDEFLGPAPVRPYLAAYPDGPDKGKRIYHDFAWRGWWDFGTGALGDMACHTANMAFMALKLGYPTKVSAEAGDVNPETCPTWAHCTIEFPARDGMDPVTWHWYEGKKDGKKVTPPAELLEKVLRQGEQLAASGSILVGTKGILFSPNDYGAQFRLTPEKDFQGINITKPEKLPINGRGDDQAQKNEWVEAIKAGKPQIALSNFDYSGMLTETVLLGNVAIRAGKSFEWDGPACKAKNCPEADKYIRRVYRKGWDLIGYNA